MTRPVHLGRKLVLEERVKQPNSSGGFDENWVTQGTHWVDLQPLTGRERLVSGRTVSKARYKIVCRNAPHSSPARPSPSQRFREGGRVYDVVSVSDRDAKGRYLEIIAEEGAVR